MKKILVIEDEAEVREVIVTILQTSGFWVSDAGGGQTGIELAQQQFPDLIICDVLMPEVDGYDVLQALRQGPATAAIPFIFLTALAEKSDMRKGMDLGADDYLTKPFLAEELLAAVRSRLEKHEVITRRSEKKLEDLRGNIIYALPHELLTPLTAILGFSKFLAADYADLERTKIGEMARDISEAANRLHELIQNFLVYAQIEVMATDPNRTSSLQKGQTLNTAAIIRDISLQRASHCGRESDLATELVNGWVWISEENLKKVIAEVVDNALKFSQPGTPVRIITASTDEWFTIKVTDRGRGMTPEQTASVGAYMQFGRQLYEQQGSGLGLVIAKRLVELHGGHLSVESVPYQSTTVSIALRPVM